MRTFTIDITPPAVPTPLSPVNGGSVTNPQLSLSWSKVSDAVSYDVLFTTGVQTDPNNNPYPPPTHLGNVTSYKLPVTISEGTYSWAVRAYDAAGNVSKWSVVQTFTVLAGQTVLKTPTPTPSANPTLTATPVPTTIPSASPTTQPTEPTDEPSPSLTPTFEPSATPTPIYTAAP